MRIECPACGFSKEVDPSRIPAGAVQISCPKCATVFEGRGADEVVAPLSGVTAPAVPPAMSPSAETPAVPPAGFWLRAGALMIDLLCLGVAKLFLGGTLMLLAMVLRGGSPAGFELAGQVVDIFGFASYLSWYLIFTLLYGQTPGKMLLRIRVEGELGAELSLRQVLIREVPGKFLSLFLFGAGFFMAAFDGKRRGLHDLLAKSRVVRIPAI